jgi:hypothetical protein
MRSRTLTTGLTLTLAGSAFAVAAPVGTANAMSTPRLPGQGAGAGLAPIISVAKTPLVRRDVRLARTLAHVKGTKLKASYSRTIRHWSLAKLTRHHAHLRRALKRAKAAQHASTASPALQAIAACESGGNPATDTGNGFYGKYQFTLATWQAVGGSGNPAQASEAEQDRRAAMLYASAGPGQWPVCGR